MKAIFAVQNTTWTAVKIRPEKNSGLYRIWTHNLWIFFRLYFHYCSSSVLQGLLSYSHLYPQFTKWICFSYIHSQWTKNLSNDITNKLLLICSSHAKDYLKTFVFYELLESVYNEKIAFFITVTNVSSVEPFIRRYTLFCSFGVIQIAYQWN